MCRLITPKYYIKQIRFSLLVLVFLLCHGVFAQDDKAVSAFLDDFLNQIQDGGVAIDEEYLRKQNSMPADMRAALQDSLQGKESFYLQKNNSTGFISNFLDTIEKYGFEKDGNSIRLKNNRILNLSITGPNLKSLFGAGADTSAWGADTIDAHFPVRDINSDLYQTTLSSNLDLKDPANNKKEVILDSLSGNYVFSNTIGDEELNVPVAMSPDEYNDYSLQNSLSHYWRDNSFNEDADGSKKSLLNLDLDFSSSSQLFGKGGVSIKPRGYAELTFSIKTNKTSDPTISEKDRKNTYFDLDPKIQMNVTGSVGDKINLDMNYNTEATFNFDNEFKLELNGEEDDIIKNLKAGNVSMPSVGSMITVGGSSSSGGQNSVLLPGYQKLFGFQNTQQYGKLTWAWVVSQQESETQTMTLEGGAAKQEFEITIDNYDANRHFFLTHFFKENYDRWMKHLPNTDISGLNINKIEVWVTNKRGDFDQARNVVAFMDMAEPDAENIQNSALWNPSGEGYPSNSANSLYNEMTTTYANIRDLSAVNTTLGQLENTYGFVNGEDYEKVENARLLSPSEYTLNPTLGYISLSSALNADEVLAVAFQYTYRGQVYQVGEFSSGNGVTAPNSLFLKMLRSTNQSPSLPTWDLMMKNIYSLGYAYNISQDDFQFSVVYFDDKVGAEQAYLNAGMIENKLLLRVMGLDTLNRKNERGADGFFDWVEGYTISAGNGRVIFPVREPFGSHLKEKITGGIPAYNPIAEKYIFQELYDTTLVVARQNAEKNKFRLVGSYKSSTSSEIKLSAMNIPRGSVKVTAGGRQLTENVDYTVDYNSGYLRILNEGILESGQTISISMENQNVFSMQKKTMLGTNLVYRFSDDLQIGASVTHLRERPTTTKVTMGSDPIANTVWGATGGWNTELPFLTKALDKLPFTDTKAPSSLTVRGEVAQLIAGHHKQIGNEGAVYIDDFESTKIGINIQNYYAWDISSVPARFKESESNDLDYGYNRAKLSWYSIDRMMQENTITTPSNIKDNDEEQSNHYVRGVYAEDLFPKTEKEYGESSYIPILNLAYYPDERGPYNYDTDINERGRLNNPEDRWAGITRKIETTNFENSNIEYIEFWMMDPYIYEEDKNDPALGGQVFINLGNVSEDVLKDGRKSFENGLPTSLIVQDVDTTIWGRVSTKQSLVDAFDNNESARDYQDVGLDGFGNDDEASFFDVYLEEIEKQRAKVLPAYQGYLDSLISDPSQDDYQYFRGSNLDALEMGVLDRYKYYNNYEGNSPSTMDSEETYPTASTTMPDGEDINQDFTLSESQSYYEYGFNVSPIDTAVGDNFIVDTRIETVTLVNGNTETVKWYQYRIPVHDYDPTRTVGSISDFTSIRFMRMYMTGFQKPVVMRLANFELIRSEWRRYGLAIEPDIYDEINGDLDVEAVNYEENSDRSPVSYILPPNVTRMVDPSQPSIRQLNEQSMVMRVRKLSGRDSRAAYKVMQMDFRQYENLQMWIHAESLPIENADYTELKDGDLSMFIRLGSDYNENYYEYELPLSLTPAGFYNGENTNDRYIVWPEDNRLDVPLELFTELKLQRDGNGVGNAESFTQIVADKPSQKISIKGSPSLSNVKVVMIGVRNTNSKTTDSRSAEVWVNELRLTGLNEDGGWAGNGSMTLKLADIGSASASGQFSTAGWGNIEQTLMQRQLEKHQSFDVSTSLELGKILPRKAKLQIPMYYAYSKQSATPKYDPVNQDLLLDDKLDAASSKSERDSILREVQTFQARKSLNFSNVKVNIQGKKKRFYDPVNLSLNYSYVESAAQNETIERELEMERNMGINYNYAPSPKPIEPFKKIEALQSDYLALIRDFNFYWQPQKLALNTNLNRSYFEQQNRDLSGLDTKVPLLVSKDMFWNSGFNLNYKLAKSLSVDYNIKTFTVVDEIDFTDAEGNLISIEDWKESLYENTYEHWHNEMMDSLMSFGRMMDYSQTFNARYTLPLSKIPLLDFIKVDASYASTYGWQRGSEAFEMEAEDGSSIMVDNGNTIRNTQRGTINSSLTMNTLYNKSKYLSDVSRKYGRLGANTRKQFKTVKYEKSDINIKKGEIYTINHNLGSSKATVKIVDADGKTIYGKKDTKSDNAVDFVPNEDIKGGKISVTARVEDKDTFSEKLAGYSLNLLMGIKNISLNFTRDGSTTLPGFKPDNTLFAANTTPGWDFALGKQSRSIIYGDFRNSQYGPQDEFGIIRDYHSQGWLVLDSTLAEPYMVTYGDQIALRATVEPLPGLSIKLTGNYAHQERLSAFYIDNNGFNPETNLSRSGNFSHTWIGLATLFEKQNDEFYTSDAFERFKAYQSYFASRQQSNMHSKVADKNSYQDVMVDPNSVDVLIPAFLAAYSSKDPDLNDISLSPKPSWRSMLPNWTVTYSGLAKAKFLKDYLKNLTLSHNYTSTYTIGNYISLTDFDEADPGILLNTDGGMVYQSQYDISAVTVAEGLNPLIGVDVTLKNNVEFNFAMNKMRALSLNIASNQLVENRNDEIVIGAGYRFEDLQLFVRTSKDSKKKSVNNDLRLNADFSIRDVVSVIRRIDEDNIQPSSGNKLTALKITANYNLSKNVEITLFYDKQITNPVVSSSYRTSNSNFGLSFRFSLIQ